MKESMRLCEKLTQFNVTRFSDKMHSLVRTRIGRSDEKATTSNEGSLTMTDNSRLTKNSIRGEAEAAIVRCNTRPRCALSGLMCDDV
jgi:hypothetical protein